MAAPASLLWKCIQSPWQREDGTGSKVLDGLREMSN